MSNLNEAMSAYQSALENLLASGAGDREPLLLHVLLARDGIARALANSPITSETAGRLVELDEQLKTNVASHGTLADPNKLRRTLQPSLSAWWWSLDETEHSPHPLWTILASLCITVALSFTAEISRRFLSGGPDFVGVFSTLSQGLLTIVAGATFTQSGREAINTFLSRLGIHRRFQPTWKAGLAFLLLTLVLALRLSLPSIARLYNDQGARDQQMGRMNSAIENYQRAVSLNPDYAQAHYNLATAYEDVWDFDKALTEYQIAIRADPRLFLAYNNLARLYLLRRNDNTNALALLNSALEVQFVADQTQQTAVRYALLKNRGWAYLGLKSLTLAETDLRQSLTLRPDGAAAHCLFARVLEARGAPKDALTEWETCVRYEKGDFVEANWIALARERLSQGAPK